MKTTTIENIIASEIMDRYNSCAFDGSEFFFEFDYDNDTVVEVTGSIKVEGYDDSYDYYNSVGEFIITSVDVDIQKVEFFNEDGLIPIRIDLAKIDRLVEMYIR